MTHTSFFTSRRWMLAIVLVLIGAPLARSLAHVDPATAMAAEPLNDAIGQAMKQMNDALKALGKGITAETRDASLEELSKLETAVIAAKSQTPESASKIDDKKRAAFVADYRKTLVEALRFACDAESLTLEGKYKDADTIVRNKLGGLKATGHGKFKTDGK